MRWYEYRMEVDELHASDELKAKLMAMQPSAASVPSEVEEAKPEKLPEKKRRKPVYFPVKRVLGIAACFVVGFAACDILLGGVDVLGLFRVGSSGSAASTATYSMAEAPRMENYSLDTASAYDMENSETAVLSEGEAAAGSADGGTGSSLQEAKIIYTANLTIESKDYDTARTELDSALASAGGYMESSNESTSSYNSVRSLSLTLRVPEENYSSFLAAASEIGNVTNRSEQAEDVTTQYMDVETRLNNLKAQRTRLQELQAQAENLSDLLEIESSLTDVQSQIESWQSQLDWYDKQVSCCTVYVYLDEVKEYTPDAQNFGERFIAALTGGWSAFVNGLQQLAVWFAGKWPVVVIAAAAVAVAVVRKKKHREK